MSARYLACTAAPSTLQAVERVDALLEGQQLLLPHTPNVGLTNALMASVAEHPFMSEALRLLPAYAHAWCAAAAPPRAPAHPPPPKPDPARPPACLPACLPARSISALPPSTPLRRRAAQVPPEQAQHRPLEHGLHVPLGAVHALARHG